MSTNPNERPTKLACRGLWKVYGTQAELNASGTSRCLPGSGKTLNGTVAGLAGQQSADIALGSASQSVSAPSTTYQLADVPDGALDLVASRSISQITGTGFETSVDKLIIRRAQNFANNAGVDGRQADARRRCASRRRFDCHCLQRDQYAEEGC